jgi:hypothetical protein
MLTQYPILEAFAWREREPGWLAPSRKAGFVLASDASALKARLQMARLPYIKTFDQFSYVYRHLSPPNCADHVRSELWAGCAT